jgi:sigma-B regulation protein RsbU (phosphoserine phosphatase)
MLQRSARLQYALLALVAVLALTHFYLGAARSIDNLAHGTERPGIPFFLGTLGHAVRLTTPEAVEAGRRPGDTAVTVTLVMPEAKAAGLNVGDAILDINNRPFTGIDVLIDELARSRAGDSMALTILHPDESEQTIHFTLAPQRTNLPPAWAWVLQLTFTFLPLLCLLTGLYAVFARPRNAHAWLILGVLAYVPALFIQAGEIHSPLAPLAIAWNVIAQNAMPICLMLFGIYFPERSVIDIRVPWLKWLFLVPLFVFFPIDLFTNFGHSYNFNADAFIDPWALKLNNVENLVGIFAISYFFAAIATKVGTTTGDARRRLKILFYGSAIGLTPLFILLLISIVLTKDVGQDIPRWILIACFVNLLLFPLSLAYVVIVHRAVDLRILIRQGTRYAFARGTINLIRTALAIWLAIALIRLLRLPQHRTVDIVQIFAIIALFFIFRFILSKRLQQWVDQRFFREAYSTEKVLSELSEEARNFTEVAPLIDTITQRIGQTLHVDRIAVFLRSGDTFRLQLATGAPLLPGTAELFAVPAAFALSTLSRSKAPASVYRDDSSSWLVDASDAERNALADLSTELLVPLPGRNRLAGVIALGPKRSEEPYSSTDRQLLQTVASQTGLALENAELLENLTTEVAQRERISRDLEIAREVQQRLFPQTYPNVPGVDLAGHCRPAQAIGGDYYDYFLLDDGRLALALGDISGKGIYAALLMASLRASIRSLAFIQQGDLAGLIYRVNNLICESSTSNRYATFFYGEYDPDTRVLTYVNAGHNPPYILRAGQAIALPPTGMVVGLIANAQYEQATIPLQPGDVLLTFTDGISEAMNHGEEEWGEERMLAAIQQLLTDPNCNHSAQQLLDCVLNGADKFTAGAPQHDDMTILVCSIS